MEELRKNIRRVFWLYVLLFALVVGFLCKFVFFDSKDVISNSYNARTKMADLNMARGTIYDKNGLVLAESVLEDGSYYRTYPYGSVFSHVIGYAGLGGSGLESKYNLELQDPEWEIWQRIVNLATGDLIRGKELVTTLDTDLQQLVKDQLGKQRGAIVVMEPSTGKILAMVSYPDFDPNYIADNWDSLRQDEENSPLINRATQGAYPPGSVFKTVTVLAGLSGLSMDNYEYDCAGRIIVGGNQIRCFDETVHGHVNLKSAFSVSCNSFFSQLGLDIGAEQLRLTADSLLFNYSYPFVLDHSTSSFRLEAASSMGEIMETSIGQGKTLVTPLHMTMITASVANGGILMQPYLVDKVGGQKNMPVQMQRLMDSETSAYLTELMTSVVTSGTALNVNISGISIAGKTGTAENSSGDDHGWFTAFAPAENPEICVTVLLENCGGSRKALPIAREIIKYYLQPQ